MAGMRMTTKAERNGFKSAALDWRNPRQRFARSGWAPRRTGPMCATEPNKRLPAHPDDKRAARRTQQAARRINRLRAH